MEPDGTGSLCLHFQVYGDPGTSALSLEPDFVGVVGSPNGLGLTEESLQSPVAVELPTTWPRAHYIGMGNRRDLLMGLLGPPCITQLSLVPCLMEELLEEPFCTQYDVWRHLFASPTRQQEDVPPSPKL